MNTLADQANYTNEIAAVPNVVSHWPLGEASGTTATDVISARNGTYTGTPAFGRPALVSGAGVGTSVGLSGKDGVTIAHHNDHAVKTFTVFGHAINTNNAAARILWAKDDNTAAIGGFSAEIEPGGRPRAYFRNSGPALVEITGAAGVIPPGRQFFWAVTAGDGGLRFYVGTTPGAVTLAASSATKPDVNLAAVTAAIGRWPPSLAKPLIGRVQHTVFVAREMSQSELAALCRPLRPVVRTYTETVDGLSPVSHYPMNPSSGTRGALVDRLHDAGDASWHGDLTATGIQYWAETLAEDDARGRSIGFDGATGRGTIPFKAEHKPVAAMGGGIAFLMHADRLTRAQQILVACDANEAAGGWSVELKYSRVRAYLRDGDGVVREVRAWRAYQDGTHPFRVGIGSTHHIALTWGRQGLRLYVDGVLEAYHPTTAVADGNSPMSIGLWHNGTTAPFDGVLSHLVVFSAQPTPAQVATLARARQDLDHTPDFTVAEVRPGQAGVLGDGTGDDGPEIRSILADLLTNAGPKKLRIFPGDYQVLPAGQGTNSYAGFVPIFSFSGVQNLVIEGADRDVRPLIKLGAISKDEADLYHPVFRFRNACQGIEVRDLEIDGNREAYYDGNPLGLHDGAMIGILFDGTEVGCARRVFSHHHKSDGIVTTMDQAGDKRQCREIRITGCTFTWNGRGGYGIEDVWDMELDNCLIRDNGKLIGTNEGQPPRYGMDFESRSAARGVIRALVHHNTVRNNANRCIAIEGYPPDNPIGQHRQIRIFNNDLRQSGDTGPDDQDVFFAIRPNSVSVSDVEIVDNTIGQLAEAAWGSTGVGVLRRITITDNVFLGEFPNRSPGQNIRITSVIQIHDSTIRRNSTPGGVSITPASGSRGNSFQTGSETPTPEAPPS